MISRRDRNKLDKAARLERAAMRLFSERGFDATTTKAVADEAGVATGTVFLYADDKADLLVLAMKGELARIVEERLATMPAAPLVEQLLHFFGGFIAFYAARAEIAARFVQTLLVHRGKNAEALDRLTVAALERLAMLVEAAIERGELVADVPPLLLAQNCFALYFGAVSAWLRGYVPTVEEALGLLRMSLELQLRGLRTDE
jgi:TetR/AcrR family transcriptional regulator, cholesterol catabolism regulator